jgi:hypothetical protein
MKKTRALAAVTALTIGAAAAWAQLALKPGQYHVQLETTLPGAQPMTQEDTDCLSPDDAKDIVKAMMRELASAESCTANNIRTNGNTLTFEAACDVQGAHVTSSAELTITGDDAYTAIMKIGASGAAMTMKITGKWVGATCTQ